MAFISLLRKSRLALSPIDPDHCSTHGHRVTTLQASREVTRLNAVTILRVSVYAGILVSGSGLWAPEAAVSRIVGDDG